MAEKLTVNEKLLTGAEEVLRSGRILDLTVRKIVQASGRSTMCVYSHFGGRAGLLGALLVRLAERIEGEVRKAPDAERDDAYRRAALTDPEAYTLVFDHPLADLGVDPSVRAEVLERVAAAFGAGADGRERWARLHGEIRVALSVESAGLAADTFLAAPMLANTPSRNNR